MKKIQILAIASVILFLSGTTWAAHRGVTEINEGTIRQVYIKKPFVDAQGYVVADWDKGRVRVEVQKFPRSETGYEVFLFEIDAKKFMKMMFVDGQKDKGVIPNPPPFSKVAEMIKQWKSLGDLTVDHIGNGALVYRKGDNLYESGLNMIMIIEKVTAGQHEGPEDISKLMVECNGPLTGTKGSEGMEKPLTVLPKK